MNQPPTYSRNSRGTTLLELMTALAVLGVLIGIGVPSFASMMRNSQLAARSSDLSQALTLARSESMKRGVRVSVCPTENPNVETPVCDADGNWNLSWIAFADDFGAPGEFSPSDQLIQAWPASANGVTVVGSGVAVTYLPSGAAFANRAFAVSKQGCKDTQRRRISVQPNGRVTLANTACDADDIVAVEEEE